MFRHVYVVCFIWFLLGDGSWVPPPSSPTLGFYRSPDDDPDKNLWLFDVSKDPNEHTDVSESNPEVVKMMLTTMMRYNETAVPCRYPPTDPNSTPSLHNGTFTWWLWAELWAATVWHRRCQFPWIWDDETLLQLFHGIWSLEWLLVSSLMMHCAHAFLRDLSVACTR